MPYESIESSFQHGFSVNVWCDLTESCWELLIEPLLFERLWTAANYLHFHRKEFTFLMEDVPLDTMLRMFFQYDGTPHISAKKFVGHDGPINWPPRSPGITLPGSIYGILWKKIFCKTGVETIVEFLRRIMSAVLHIGEHPSNDATDIHIREHPETIQRTLNSCLNRTRLYVESHSGYFEKLT
jgi:hypothetical protein